MAKSNPPKPSGKVHLSDWVAQAGVVREVLSELDHEIKKRRRARQRTARMLVAVVGLIGVLAWWIPYLQKTDTIATVTANRQTIRLHDGSQAELNARTSLRTDFRYGRRLVRLDRGEAYFSVASDPAHPFEVHTPSGVITVLGTEFNVRLEDDQVEVTVAEGKVRITSPSRGLTENLAGGQQWSTQTNVPVTLLEGNRLEQVTAWRQGRALFDRAALSQVVKRFEEYHGVRFTLDPAVESLRMGGSYLLADLDEFVEALPKALPIRVIRRSETLYAIVPR